MCYPRYLNSINQNTVSCRNLTTTVIRGIWALWILILLMKSTYQHFCFVICIRCLIIVPNKEHEWKQCSWSTIFRSERYWHKIAMWGLLWNYSEHKKSDSCSLLIVFFKLGLYDLKQWQQRSEKLKHSMEHYSKGRNEEEELNSANIPLIGIPKGHGWMLITGGTRFHSWTSWKTKFPMEWHKHWKSKLWTSQHFTLIRLQTALGPACTLIKEEGTLGV